MNLLNSLKTLTLALILSIGIGYAYAAWAPPTQVPTGGNAEAPVNVGSATQLKAGGLAVNGLLRAVGILQVGDTSTTATCNSSTRGAIKYDGTDFFGCVASGWKSLTVTGGSASPPPSGLETFTSSGTFTVPAGVTTISVEVWGAGGGGGFYNGGSGGGGGGYAKSVLSVAPNSTHSVTVGSGGRGATYAPGNCSAGTRGSNGGTSSFGTFLSATGGGGGGSFGTSPGGGGTGIGGNITNSSGSSGVAGTATGGRPIIYVGGNGGTGALGGGGGLGARAASPTAGAGSPPGGGGGGAIFNCDGAPGGNGARGQVTVSW